MTGVRHEHTLQSNLPHDLQRSAGWMRRGAALSLQRSAAAQKHCPPYGHHRCRYANTRYLSSAPSPAPVTTHFLTLLPPPQQERSEKAQHRLQKAVEFTTLLLADLIDSSLIGVDVAGRDVVRVAAMPKTAVYQSQVRARSWQLQQGACGSLAVCCPWQL